MVGVALAGCDAQVIDSGMSADGGAATSDGGYPAGAIATLSAGKVSVFAEDAAEDAAPLSTLVVAPDAYRIAFDSARWLYVLSDEQLEVFPSGASGYPVPTRLIGGHRARFILENTWGLLVDPAGFVYVATYAGVNVFAPSADGDVAPVRRIWCGDRPLTWSPFALVLDAQDRLVVAGDGALPIEVFPSGAHGAATPILTFGSEQVRFRSLALAPDGTIVAGHEPGNAISFFAREADPPAFELAGQATGFDAAAVESVAVEQSGRVLTASASGVFAFAPGARGDAAPVARITSEPSTSVAVAP